jgi:hypothetical protein
MAKDKDTTVFYFRMVDATGSFTDPSQGLKLGGASNVPRPARKTANVIRALNANAIELVQEKVALKAIEAHNKKLGITPSSDVKENSGNDAQTLTEEQKKEIISVANGEDFQAMMALIRKYKLSNKNVPADEAKVRLLEFAGATEEDTPSE